jgi:hypothetical protein
MPFRTIANRIEVRGDNLWLMTSANAGIDLVKVSLATNGETPYFGWNSRFGKQPIVLDGSGNRLSEAEQRKLDHHWGDSAFGLRGGTPIIANKRGELFESLGKGTLRRWDPQGYSAALREVTNKKYFSPTSIANDHSGGLVILGRQGLIRIPATGTARGIIFPNSVTELPPWNSVIELDDGSIILLGGASTTKPTPHPARVRPDGVLERLNWGGEKYCNGFDGTLAIVGSAEIGGVGKRPDGTIVVNDLSCGQIYAIQLPATMQGTPYSK